MAHRIREVITDPLPIEYFQQHIEAGWVLTAVEWTKPEATTHPVAGDDTFSQEAPYGQTIASDCAHLTGDPAELKVLLLIYERVVAGWRPPNIAAELNELGYRTRAGSLWTPSAVFDLLPRLIELSPKLQAHPEWHARRAVLQRVG